MSINMVVRRGVEVLRTYNWNPENKYSVADREFLDANFPALGQAEFSEATGLLNRMIASVRSAVHEAGLISNAQAYTGDQATIMIDGFNGFIKAAEESGILFQHNEGDTTHIHFCAADILKPGLLARLETATKNLLQERNLSGRVKSNGGALFTIIQAPQSVGLVFKGTVQELTTSNYLG